MSLLRRSDDPTPEEVLEWLRQQNPKNFAEARYLILEKFNLLNRLAIEIAEKWMNENDSQTKEDQEP